MFSGVFALPCSPKIGINGESVSFTLEAIVEHNGNSANSGHYYSYLKNQGRWFKVNDSSITEVTDLSEQPYICIYRKSVKPMP